ncbi:Phosphatidylserine decarboxylase proenzyme [Legionella massiliensis]|uniref:Phosphatidylserine decarboxylase proenzyme n=1 Tax=Legionella massiliensis TaxID=1034943 RepID=A0A078KWS4_9GAMM|nr:archaetidylserine decarboxylase [Legionella massiliensis]CDZ76193.1 Phosphatidylserine decarboxylase proenzyme [Legionella massiliensis]CEE11931.1 Phosphatidylserine decarboxylase proenzyme [Legionella massiliensis]
MFKDYLKTAPQYLLPKQGLTQLAGFLSDVQRPAIKNALIRFFIQRYQVNMAEAAEENPDNYSCFNEFFIRHLKPECRPLAKADIVSPVDGIISELGSIKEGQILQAKGRYYTVAELLACDAAVSQQFTEGRFATLYLSPKDYHRIHMPIDAQLKEMIYVPGKLFSVQPTTARVIPHLFARNERLVCFFNTNAGLMAMVLVGATIVGAIGTRWQGDIQRSEQKQYFDFATLSEAEASIKQGDEMGYFKLGSTVVLLFAKGQEISWHEGLKAGTNIRYGQAFADLR